MLMILDSKWSTWNDLLGRDSGGAAFSFFGARAFLVLTSASGASTPFSVSFLAFLPRDFLGASASAAGASSSGSLAFFARDFFGGGASSSSSAVFFLPRLLFALVGLPSSPSCWDQSSSCMRTGCSRSHISSTSLLLRRLDTEALLTGTVHLDVLANVS